MRTKALLMAAAALAAGIATSNAQVYSQNVVGYEAIPLSSGYTMIANSLDADGTGTNNNVVTVFGTNLLANTTVLAWSPSLGTYNSALWINSKGTLKWTGDTNDINIALNTGAGVFVQSPSATTNTIVGDVIQGTNNVNLVPGYNLVSFTAPVAGAMQTQLGYPPTVGDTILTWSPSAQSFTGSFLYILSKGTPKWSPSEPVLTAGQPVFINTSVSKTWTNTFTVQ